VQGWPELSHAAVQEAVKLAADSLQDRYMREAARSLVPG